jgi:hypothetical protein
MNPAIRYSAGLLLAATVTTSALADSNRYHPRSFTYEVTITNITKGQVFSPPVLVSHNRNVALFELGEPALHELAIVAEDGDGGPLVDLLNSLPEVADARASMAPILPGASAVFELTSNPTARVLSVVSMMVNTNDAIFAIDSEALPRFRRTSKTYYALGYDAGSEGNNEDCAFVPGPACPGDSGNLRSTGDSEGYVHVHNGVHGVADLVPADYDWRNPVAVITVVRTR